MRKTIPGAALICCKYSARPPPPALYQSPACVTFDMGQVEMDAWFSDECLGGAERPYVTVLVR